MPFQATGARNANTHKGMCKCNHITTRARFFDIRQDDLDSLEIFFDCEIVTCNVTYFDSCTSVNARTLSIFLSILLMPSIPAFPCL